VAADTIHRRRRFLISSLPLQRWLSHLNRPLQSPGNVETERHENHSPDWWFLKNGKAGHLIDLVELKDITGSSPTDFGITHLKKTMKKTMNMTLSALTLKKRSPSKHVGFPWSLLEMKPPTNIKSQPWRRHSDVLYIPPASTSGPLPDTSSHGHETAFKQDHNVILTIYNIHNIYIYIYIHM
jgi:hypothetical protein